MRSLFGKILLWFIGTTIITSVGVAITSAIVFEANEAHRPPMSLMFSDQVEHAEHAYQAGGSEALAHTLGRFHHMFHADFRMTDSAGKDLVDGKDLSKLLARARTEPRSFFRRQFMLARQDASGKHWLIVVSPRRPWTFWFLRPEHLWVLGVAVLLCYGLAYHLSSPVRRLQETVDRFGRGDFAARAETNRRDELGQLARAFNEMAERLQTLLAAERRLLLDISHELRSPLARLSVAVELARSGGDQEATLDRIQKEADRLNILIGELLQVTRAEGDKSRRRMDPVELDELVSQVKDDSEIEAEAKNCVLELKADSPLHIAGDAELLRRAIENVVRNAIRYSPKDSTVEIRAEARGAQARITVRDQGPGVPEEALARIFDPFYRVESDRNRVTGGVGLGLSIARRAIALHEGKLEARNANPGLLVTMDLPLAETSKPAAIRELAETS